MSLASREVGGCRSQDSDSGFAKLLAWQEGTVPALCRRAHGPCLLVGDRRPAGTGRSPDTPQGLHEPQGACPASTGMLCVSRAGKRDASPPMYPPAFSLGEAV